LILSPSPGLGGIIYVAFGQYAFVDKDETVMSKIVLQVVNVCVIQLQEVVNVIRKAVNDHHGWNRETSGLYSIPPDFGLSQYIMQALLPEVSKKLLVRCVNGVCPCIENVYDDDDDDDITHSCVLDIKKTAIEPNVKTELHT